MVKRWEGKRDKRNSGEGGGERKGGGGEREEGRAIERTK